jgi:hypothetical protein
MATFKVKTPIRKDGTDYAPGSKIELSEKEAASIPHALENPPAPAEKKDKEKEK